MNNITEYVQIMLLRLCFLSVEHFTELQKQDLLIENFVPSI